MLISTISCSDIDTSKELIRQGKYTDAIELLNLQVNEGDAQAQQMLAALYLEINSFRIAKNEPLSYELTQIHQLIKSSADKGNRESQYQLGLLQERKIQITLPDELPRDWMLLAAKNGHGKALQNRGRQLRVFNEFDASINSNISQALMFYRLALQAGCFSAQTDIDFLKKMVTSEEFDALLERSNILIEQWKTEHG